MKRLLSLFAFSAYSLLTFAAPLAAAIDTSEIGEANICSFGTSYATYLDTSDTAEEKAKQMSAAEEKYSKAYKAGTCGLLNETTNLYEKGDCNISEGDQKPKIITEIVEPIAPSIQLNENTQVLDVYAGVCCAAYSTYSDNTFKECTSTRTVYADTLSNCQTIGKALNCSKRQWLIAESGVGLLKLFVKQLYTFAAFAVGMVAVGLLVFHGVKISMSGVTGDISDSKNKIMQALAGIVLLFLSGLILYIINPDFFS